MSARSTGAGRANASMLIVELSGRCVTAALTDLVAGRARLIASTESWMAPAETDPLEALGRSLADLEVMTGQRLLHDSQLLAPRTDLGAGCDAVLLTAGRPLRVAVIATTRASATGLHEQLELPTAWIGEAAAVDGLLEERVGLLRYLGDISHQERPDVLIAVGPSDSLPSEEFLLLARALILTQSTSPRLLPPLILAAGQASRERFASIVRQSGYRAVDILFPRFRECEPDGLRKILPLVWAEQQLPTTVTRALAAATDVEPLQRLEGLRRAGRALASSRESVVWLVDVNEAEIVVVRADSAHAELVYRPLDQFAPGRSAIEEWRRRPWLVPGDRATVEEVRSQITEAIAQAAAEIRGDERAEPLPGLLVGRGTGLVHQLPASDAALALALGIGLVGPVSVALDRHQLLAGLGALLDEHAERAGDLIDECLDVLGTVVIGRTSALTAGPESRLRVEALAATSANAVDVAVDQVEILSGDLLADGEIALIPGRSVDVGLGDSRRRQLAPDLGEVGVVVAVTRGRAPRRWARVPRPRVRLPSFLGGGS